MPTLYTDNDPFCCQVLRARVADGSLPPGNVLERDVREIAADDLRPYQVVHLFAGIGGFGLAQLWSRWPDDSTLLTGGFPCQQTSVAAAIHGYRTGLAGNSSGLWSEMLRLVGDIRTLWVIVENPPGIDTWSGEIKAGLEGLGYGVSRTTRKASDLAAPHERRRRFFVANRDGKRLALSRTDVPREAASSPWPAPPGNLWRADQSDALRMDDGLPDRMDRIRALGNAIVPQVATEICKAIIEAEWMT